MADASNPHRYALALGSNRRHGRYGSPAFVLRAAVTALGDAGLSVVALSPVMASPPLGPSRRRYANAAAIVETNLDPQQVLALLKRIERDFGRRPGRRWGARVLDLDIILWTGGGWSSPTLTVPHLGWRERRFVAEPLAYIAADWRDPVSGLTVRHIARRLRHARPVDPAPRTA
jgi:2-amino-4-hydroxy-6-hydroxymethyldihydropteridine diphosphokinase